MASPFQMTSPLSREELVDTLRREIDSAWTFFGKKAVVGNVSSTGLWIVQRHNYRNSFQTVLTATLSPTDSGGTLLSCRAGMSAVVIAFLCVWFGGVIMIGGAFVPPLFNDAPFGLERFMVPGMLLFGVGIVTLGRWMAKGEDEFLVAFLEDAVDARR